MYIDDSVKSLTGFEGFIPWMMLDTRGYVTCGVGQMLPNPAAACALPFMNIARAAASEDEIVADCSRVKAMKPGQVPSAYRIETSLTLSAQSISDLLRYRVNGFDGQLRGYFTDYDAYPDCAKVALLDMCFNLGFGGLLRYPTMNAAIKVLDWATAAKECHRNSISDDRNEWARKQFLAAIPTENI